MPLRIWVKINVTKDLKWLITEGEPSVDDLFFAWNKINDEYRELSRDIDSNYSFDLKKEIDTDDLDIIVITMIVNQLKIRRTEPLIEKLKNHFNFKFDYVDLHADLEKTLTAASARIMQLQVKENEYKNLPKTKTDELSEFDFIEQLVILSEDNHYRVDVNLISLAEYVALYNKFKAKVEFQLQHQQHA